MRKTPRKNREEPVNWSNKQSFDAAACFVKTLAMFGGGPDHLGHGGLRDVSSSIGCSREQRGKNRAPISRTSGDSVDKLERKDERDGDCEGESATRRMGEREDERHVVNFIR